MVTVPDADFNLQDANQKKIALTQPLSTCGYLSASGLMRTRGSSLGNNAKVAQQVEEINSAQLAMLFALAKLSHTRDDDTGLHLERVQHLCKLLASALSETPNFKYTITPDFITTIFHTSPLHDLGKVGIVDAIFYPTER